MAPHSSTLAWKIPQTEEPGRLQSMGSLTVGDDWATSLSLFTFMHWRRKWQPTPAFLRGKSYGQKSLVGYSAFIVLLSSLVKHLAVLCLVASVRSDSPILWTVSCHGILQARMLEWVAISFSRGSSQTRDGTQLSHIADSLPTGLPWKPKYLIIKN